MNNNNNNNEDDDGKTKDVFFTPKILYKDGYLF